MRHVRLLVILTLSGLLLGACGGRQGALQPPEIYYGQDTCARCGMLISDPRFAAALLTEEGE